MSETTIKRDPKFSPMKYDCEPAEPTASAVLADIMDVLRDLQDDMEPKGGRLREKMILKKAFDIYEQHRIQMSAQRAASD